MDTAALLLQASDVEWQDTPIPGARFAPLHENPETGACVWLIYQNPGGVFPEHSHPHWTVQFILKGEITGPEGTYKPDSYQRLPPNVKHGPYRAGPHGMEGLLISDGPVW